MVPEVKNQILISYFQSQGKYEKLALEIQRFFEIDPNFPKESLYTIKYRLKDEERLIEKLEGESDPDASNFREKIKDLLGLRIVCLRHSDVKKVEDYLNYLNTEQKLVYVHTPERKLPPFMWISSADTGYPQGDIQYSGYSSMHYVVKPGPQIGFPQDLNSLYCEIQVRTILEEAWGEIDHKYRYEIKRKGAEIPSGIDRGFRAFSAYIQASIIQVEYLCKDIEEYLSKSACIVKPQEPVEVSLNNIETVLNNKVGFIPTERTLNYIERRMLEAGYYENVPLIIRDKVLSHSAMQIFNNIFNEIMQRTPFTNPNDREVDLVMAINFSLFRLIQMEEVAIENLKSILLSRQRKEAF